TLQYILSERVLHISSFFSSLFFFFQAEDGIRDRNVTGVQTCALPISSETLANHCSKAAKSSVIVSHVHVCVPSPLYISRHKIQPVLLLLPKCVARKTSQQASS